MSITLQEILDEWGFESDDFDQYDYRVRLKKEINEYTNQRIIEELGRLRGIGITYTDDAIDKRIKELK